MTFGNSKGGGKGGKGSQQGEFLVSKEFVYALTRLASSQPGIDLPLFRVERGDGHPISLTDGMDLHLYRDVRFVSFYPKSHDRMNFVLEFQNPFLDGRKPGFCREYWEKGNNLKFGSLIVLIGWREPHKSKNCSREV